MAAIVLVCLVTAAGCGGGSSSSIPSGPAPTGLTKFTIVVPPVPTSTSATARRPRYISPSTQSVTFTVAGGGKTTFALTPSSPGCVQGSNGLTCTLVVPVPIGTSNVTVATFASTDGSGTPLSIASVTVTVVAGTVSTVPLTLNGAIASLTVSVSPSGFTAGTASTASVTVNALDASGQIIVGPGVYVDTSGNPVTVTLTDSDTSGATHLSGTTVTAPGTSITLTYNGASIGTFTISASAPGVTTATATVSVVPQSSIAYLAGVQNGCTGSGTNVVEAYQILSTGGIGSLLSTLDLPGTHPAAFMTLDRNGNLFVLITGDAPARIVEYPRSASGTPAPSATISGPSTGLAAAVTIAADSAGGIWAAEPSSNGSQPQLVHFAAGSNGPAVVPDRTITGIANIPPTLTFEAQDVAVDSHDNVYTTAEQVGGSQARAYELPAASNGTATPTASYGFDWLGVPLGVTVDQYSDTVWVWPVDAVAMGIEPPQGPGQPNFGGVAAFPPGSVTPSRVLYGTLSFPPNASATSIRWNFTSVAFDSAHNTYVQYAVKAGTPCGAQRLSVFGPSQNGNVAPLQNQDIDTDEPFGIAIPVLATPPPASGTSGSPSSSVKPSPSSFTFTANGSQYAQNLSVSEPGYTGSWSAASGNTAVVTVAPAGSAGAFTVTPVGGGSTTVTVRDAFGNETAVPASVAITGFQLQGHARALR